MANWSFITKTHLALYRATGGRIGARLAGLDMLLLSVHGRKSGRLYTVPLACFPDGDDRVVVASNNGQDHDPSWLANLTVDADAQVQLGREQWAVRGFVADSQRRARLWPELKRLNSAYVNYEKKTQREIPVVILERRD